MGRTGKGYLMDAFMAHLDVEAWSPMISLVQHPLVITFLPLLAVVLLEVPFVASSILARCLGAKETQILPRAWALVTRPGHSRLDIW